MADVPTILDDLALSILGHYRRVFPDYASFSGALDAPSGLADGRYRIDHDEQMQVEGGLNFAPASVRTVSGGAVVGTENLATPAYYPLVAGETLSIVVNPFYPPMDIRRYGGGVSSSSAANAQALLRAWNVAVPMGGTVLLPEGTLTIDRVQLPPTQASKRVTIRGHGSYATILSPAQVDIGAPTGYLIRIGDTSAISIISLDGFTVQGNTTTRSNTNGIVLTTTNALRVSDVMARHLIGTGLDLEGPNNSLLDRFITFRCGSNQYQRPAFWVHGIGDREANDVRVSGTSEQDEYGWAFHDCPVLISLAPWKIHGRGDTTPNRGLEIINSRGFFIQAMLTLGFNRDGFIFFGDSEGVAVPDAYSLTEGVISGCNGTFEVMGFANLQNQNLDPASPVLALLKFDVNTASMLKIKGQLPSLERSNSGPYVMARMTATSDPGSVIDLSELHVAGTSDATHWLDDQRQATRNTQLRSIGRYAQGSYLGAPHSEWWPAGANDREIGSTYALSAPQGAINPAMRALSVVTATGAGGETLFPNLIPLSFRGSGFTTTTPFVSGFFIPTYVDALGEAGFARLSRVAIGYSGGEATWTEKHWRLLFYGVAIGNDDGKRYLNLSADQTYDTSGIGFPRRIMTRDGFRVLDFWEWGWSGGDPIDLQPNTMAWLELQQTGLPKAIDHIAVTLYFELFR